MTDIVLVGIIGGIATIAGGLIVFFSNRSLNKSNALLINADTITRLSKRIDELEARDEIKEKKIDELGKNLKRYASALDRAYRFINSHIPKDVEIPDFLMDTGELNKKQ